jgi:hypothetical protein
MRPAPLRTTYRAPARGPDAEHIKRQGFRDQGILVVSLDDHRLPWPERVLLRQIGERLYGAPARP